MPESLHIDQGQNFESALIQEICQLLGVKKTRTTPYHPQTDGLVERFNRTVLDMLSMAVQQDEHEWDLLLPQVMLAYRTSVQETTGTTPFSLIFGHEPHLPEDIISGISAEVYKSPKPYSHILVERVKRGYQLVRDHAKIKQSHEKDMFDRKVMVMHTLYHINDLVFLYNAVVTKGQSRKFCRPWLGPFKVIKIMSRNVCRIVDCSNPLKWKVVHFNRLKPLPVDPESIDNEDLQSHAATCEHKNT